jgi:uncharacterized membrane protein YphA (DoxX/SURF4 family)
MDLALLAARLLLAMVFAVAGLAKLTDWPGSRQALIDFGVPVRLAMPLGPALALADLPALRHAAVAARREGEPAAHDAHSTSLEAVAAHAATLARASPRRIACHRASRQVIRRGAAVH